MIDTELAAFLQEGLGIHIASRNAALEPNGCRALAVKVDADGRHVEVYLAKVAATRILPDLQANGQAAVGFGRPVDDRSCQVKGLFLAVRDVSEDERTFITDQWERFLANLEKIGIPRAATRAWITWPVVAIRLRANAIFDQTPGPGAGAPITSTSA
jgi:hypothetical protein